MAASKFPKEVFIGIAFFIIIAIGGWWAYTEISKPPPSEEICDLIDNDYDGEIDEEFLTTCAVDTDCGPTSTYGQSFCREGNVYINAYENKCVGEIGSCLSECIGGQTEQLQEICRGECSGGVCQE